MNISTPARGARLMSEKGHKQTYPLGKLVDLPNDHIRWGGTVGPLETPDW